jgi:hypothetical protein
MIISDLNTIPTSEELKEIGCTACLHCKKPFDFEDITYASLSTGEFIWWHKHCKAEPKISEKKREYNKIYYQKKKINPIYHDYGYYENGELKLTPKGQEKLNGATA